MLTKEQKVFILRLLASIRNWQGDLPTVLRDTALAEAIRRQLTAELQAEPQPPAPDGGGG